MDTLTREERRFAKRWMQASLNFPLIAGMRSHDEIV